MGHKVFTAANGCDVDTETSLREMGVEYCSIRMARAGMNPFADLATLVDMVQLMKRVRPDCMLAYTIKPVIYGGLAARLCGIKRVFSMVTGMGYAFGNSNAVRGRIARLAAGFLYRASLKISERVFFQNPDDCREFSEMKLVKPEQCVVVSGSGVDLETFPFQPPTGREGVRFLLIARLLRDKGIGEYAAAARMLKQRCPRAEFHVVGPFDPNPAGLKPQEIRAWEAEGLIRYHGAQTDVRPFLRECDVYVLPSYREGTPRTVLEAMATGRAIITTDAPGCRETVRRKAAGGDLKPEGLQTNRESGTRSDHPIRVNSCASPGEPLQVGMNGILVPVKSIEALVEAMVFFIEHPEQISIMGRESRRYAEDRYDVHKVNAVMLKEMGLIATT